jgi:hypothetical protein
MKLKLKLKQLTLETLYTVTDEKFYGVKMNNLGWCGIISRNDYQSGKYVVRCFTDEFTGGNCWATFSSKNLQTTIQRLLEHGGTVVFEFKSVGELFEWASHMDKINRKKLSA